MLVRIRPGIRKAAQSRSAPSFCPTLSPGKASIMPIRCVTGSISGSSCLPPTLTFRPLRLKVEPMMDASEGVTSSQSVLSPPSSPWVDLITTLPFLPGSAEPYSTLFLKSMPLALPLRRVTLATWSGLSTVTSRRSTTSASSAPSVCTESLTTGLNLARFMTGHTPGL